VGDFAFYDQVLDMSFTLGNLPERVQGFHGDALDNYFRVARGRSAAETKPGTGAHPAALAAWRCEMTKWFDTNYHYIVPEFTAATEFKLDASRLLAQLAEARAQGVKAKPVIIGPVTYLALGKAKDDSASWRCCSACCRLCRTAGYAGRAGRGMGADRRADPGHRAGRRLATCLQHRLPPPQDRGQAAAGHLFRPVGRKQISGCQPAVAGLHIDAINGQAMCSRCWAAAPHKVLSLGVINGRNIWKTDLTPCWTGGAAGRAPGRAPVDCAVVLACMCRWI
jgi:5-methyltetrahydropteroyltriglutamate--homocysteine methyltransferase